MNLGRTGLGDSDFRVLEVLLHKGPLPVNTIGPLCNKSFNQSYSGNDL